MRGNTEKKVAGVELQYLAAYLTSNSLEIKRFGFFL